jgi:hypothetical protein
MQPRDLMIGNAAQHVGEPGLRVYVVEFRRQGVHGGDALAAAIGSGEQPRAAAERSLAPTASSAPSATGLWI